MTRHLFPTIVFCAGLTLSPALAAAPFFFTTGNPDGLLGSASRPASSAKIEIESADDFTLAGQTTINSATFTGLLTGAPTIGEVRVEIYRVFPKDSDTTRTPQVPTRANSPSDVALADRDTAAANLSFTTTILNPSFTAINSVLNGINKSPNQKTGGEGPITGSEVLFNVTFTSPFILPPDHYFFIPQVQVTGGEFFWLSAAKTIPAPADLQSWIRNENLDPDWLRIGTDIVGGTPAPNFNAAFSLTGITQVPEPASSVLVGIALAALGFVRRRKER